MAIYSNHFVYDNINSSSYGLLLCTFGSSGLENISSGSVSFNLSKSPFSNQWVNNGAQYDKYIEFTFDILKMDFSAFSCNEISNINRWLMRKDGFHLFQFYCEQQEDIFFNAVATESTQLTITGNTYGLKYKFITDSPFAFTKENTFCYSPTSKNDIFQIFDVSDEIGHIYPDMKIEILEDGDMEIINLSESRLTKILNCVSGEIITFDRYKNVTTDQQRLIYNYYNFKNPRIVNSFYDRINNFSISLKCNVEIKWRSIKKVGV